MIVRPVRGLAGRSDAVAWDARPEGSEPVPRTRRNAMTWPVRAATRLLRVPLFAKILIANAIIVLAVAAVTARIAVSFARTPAAEGIEPGVLVALAGVVVSVLVNAAILWLALRPLRLLERTAARVQAGDEHARAVLSPLSDRAMERLVRTFNAMLDEGAHYRRRLREVAARALEASEEERKRLARELHDGSAQTLAAIRIKLRVARTSKDPDLRDSQLEQIGADLGEAIEEVRRMAKGLRPPSLDMLGLSTAIDAYARPLAQAAGIDVELRTAPVSGLLGRDAELAVYRIVQEALSNVVRHSGASRVAVALWRRGTSVEAVVEDDGAGFDPLETMHEPGGGLGLFGMRERALYVGGQVDIISVPGQGTRILVRVPINEAAKYA